MSRRQVRWMRAVVHGIVAGLAAMGLMEMRMVAQSPRPGFILLSGHLDQPMPALAVAGRAPVARTPVAINAAPPAAPVWMARLDPGSLWAALSLPPLPPVAAAPAAVRSGERVAEHLADRVVDREAGRDMEAGSEALHLATHHSLLVNTPRPLTRVSLTDDSIAQALVVSPTQVLIQGKAPGEVSLVTWDADNSTRAYTIEVGLDPQPLDRELNRLFPGRSLQVSASGNALVVSGTMGNAASAQQVLAVAAGFSKNVVSNLRVDAASDPGQVLLQVRFAEVDRSAVAQFGANLISTGAGNTVGSIGTGQFGGAAGFITPGTSQINPPGSTTLSGSAAKAGLDDLLNFFLFRSDANLALTLKALEQKNLLQILAEPNLVAMDGKEANFLAGGEFPFPVVQGQGAVNNVTIQFKPFGVNLHFKPTILADGTIDLQVAPEVSALDFSNALSISGFLIPALSTRRAETELELRDGQSFVIAGLMDNRLTTNAAKIPGLGDIPILGKFFRSNTTSRSRSELMVVVTAHLVRALNQAPAGPRMPQPFLPASSAGGKGR